MPSFTLSRRRALIVVGCGLAVVLILARLLGAGDASRAGPPVAPIPKAAAVDAPAPQTVVVDVEGAVRRPGLYRLRPGSRVADAIARAGGVTRRADQALVNLASPLSDGEQVIVPGVGTGSAAAGPGAGPPPPARVDLNSATVEQLDTLPGVGPVTAQKIVDYRREHGPFTSVDQLDAISGIGPTRIDNLRGHVRP